MLPCLDYGFNSSKKKKKRINCRYDDSSGYDVAHISLIVCVILLCPLPLCEEGCGTVASSIYTPRATGLGDDSPAQQRIPQPAIEAPTPGHDIGTSEPSSTITAI